MEFRVYRRWQELPPFVKAGVEELLEEAFPVEERRDMAETVSYTHLTLPTILRV